MSQLLSGDVRSTFKKFQHLWRKNKERSSSVKEPITEWPIDGLPQFCHNDHPNEAFHRWRSRSDKR